MTTDGVLVEAKCPMARDLDEDPSVPEYYFGQVQALLEILDLERCDFIQYRPARPSQNRDEDLLVITPIARDRAWWGTLRGACGVRWAHVGPAARAAPLLKRFADEVRDWKAGNRAWTTAAAQLIACAWMADRDRRTSGTGALAAPPIASELVPAWRRLGARYAPYESSRKRAPAKKPAAAPAATGGPRRLMLDLEDLPTRGADADLRKFAGACAADL